MLPVKLYTMDHGRCVELIAKCVEVENWTNVQILEGHNALVDCVDAFTVGHAGYDFWVQGGGTELTGGYDDRVLGGKCVNSLCGYHFACRKAFYLVSC